MVTFKIFKLMENNSKLFTYLNLAINFNLYSNKHNLKEHLSFIFQNTILTNKRLLDNTISQQTYLAYFKKIYDGLNSNGKIIITDCTRYNFFNIVGIKSPFMPTIEWYKHQSPTVWTKLLIDSGFKNPKIAWSYPNTFGKFGKFIFGNKIAAFFLLSHFRLELTK